MKSGKRIIALVLVLVATVCMLALPAAAASSSWVSYFKNFRMTSRYNYDIGYTSAIQSILLGYSRTDKLISDSGGVDGLFGASTAEAVAIFQQDKGLSADSIVGPDTWSAMANYLVGEYTLFSGRRKAVEITHGISVYHFHFYDTSGRIFASVPFHSAYV